MTAVEGIETQATGEGRADAGGVFSLLREAASTLPAAEWGAICVDAMVRAAGADGGLLLDAGGVTIGVVGLDDLEAYEVAMVAMSPQCDSGGTIVSLATRTLALVFLPLRVDGRSAGVAALASEDEFFVTRLETFESELTILGSAMLSNAPWMGARP
jgi:hypothetical protein